MTQKHLQDVSGSLSVEALNIMSESVEVRVARLEENMKFLVKETEQASVSRKGQYEAIETIQRAIEGMAASVASVKAKLDGQTPTIEEFITIKHKVVGASKFGKYIWAISSFIIGVVWSHKEVIGTWITHL
jgi:hypothetical protein